jgi:hypothetical protein
MSAHYKSHISLELNSKDRNSGEVNNALFHLDHQITFSQKPSKSYWLRLENNLMPKSFYTIDSNFIVFQVLEDDGIGGDDTITITIDQGNYTIIELITELESQLDSNTANANDYSLSYDDITNKVTIQYTGATSADVTIDTIANGSTLNQVLGFGKADTASITGGDNTTVLVDATDSEAPNCVDLNTKSYIIVKSDIASNNYYNTKNQQNIGVRIPMLVDRNVKQYYANDGGSLTKMNNKSALSTIRLDLEDEYGNLVDTNECDWSTEMVIYELTEPSKNDAGKLEGREDRTTKFSSHATRQRDAAAIPSVSFNHALSGLRRRSNAILNRGGIAF